MYMDMKENSTTERTNSNADENGNREWKKTFLWLDHSHPLGSLVKVGTQQMIRAFLSRRDAKVETTIKNGNWNWPTGRRINVKIRRIIEATPASCRPNIQLEDEIQWIPNKNGDFTVASTVKATRGVQIAVDWSRLLWGKYAILRYDFILRLLCQRRLTTRDRTIKWGMNIDPICALCEHEEETIDHLFFDYPISREVRGEC